MILEMHLTEFAFPLFYFFAFLFLGKSLEWPVFFPPFFLHFNMLIHITTRLPKHFIYIAAKEI